MSTESAFPSSVMRGQNGNYWTEDEGGLTKREYAAIHIAAGLAADSIPGSHHHPRAIAEEAVRVADALLAALAKAQP